MLFNGMQLPGDYQINWDGNRFASGVYFYSLEFNETHGLAKNSNQIKKMILLK